MAKTRNLETGSGIPQELAARRRARVAATRYSLRLRLPENPDEPVTGRVTIGFDSTAPDWPEIDFAPFADDAACARAIRSVTVAGRPAGFALRNGHIQIDDALPAGERHQIEIEFTAGTRGLTRRPGFAYTLFVPARAHQVFPCFDQPDLKAQLTLELELPPTWTALANAPLVASEAADERSTLRFAASDSLPSYLFAFVAGELAVRSCSAGGRRFSVACPAEAEPALDRAIDDIVALHGQALDYLERYTGIAYPFRQIGFALVPDFEFAGMEHPGVTLYRQELMLLPRGSGEAERIRRAHLIAHETAHQWFGNLVTMRWFDDVWLKEVFANFMADKIVAAAFPQGDHALRFALGHIPPAYRIDRTEGAHAIRQPLDNLAGAADLYDALIYHKAPIAMAQLERAIGERAMRRALRTYLDRYRFANADWPALQQCLRQETRADIDRFSRRWIEAVGRPRVDAAIDFDGAVEYGSSDLGDAGRERALAAIGAAALPRQRAHAWLLLYEDMLDGGVAPARLLTAALGLLATETEPLLMARVIDDLREIYWRFLDPAQRAMAAGPVERCLRLRLRQAGAAGPDDPGGICEWLDVFSRFALTTATLAELESIWRGTEPGIAAVPEPLAVRLALTLALHRQERAPEILQRQLGCTRQRERRARLEFLLPAVSPQATERDRFFRELVSGRHRPSWAIAGAALLNHALHADASLDYIMPGLHHARELRTRDDIFVPRQWLEALLSGHGTAAAAASVRAFLEQQALPDNLRRLILQCADPVWRAARIRA